jgi:hypothetical protein
MKTLVSVLALAVACVTTPTWADDPLLGIVRAVKCLNCVADSVVLQVDDPIENQEIEVRVPAREYNKILTSLGGRTLYMKPDQACFYWQIKVKKTDSTQTLTAAQSTKEKGGTGKVGLADTSATTQPTFKESNCIPYTAKSLGVN